MGTPGTGRRSQRLQRLCRLSNRFSVATDVPLLSHRPVRTCQSPGESQCDPVRIQLPRPPVSRLRRTRTTRVVVLQLQTMPNRVSRPRQCSPDDGRNQIGTGWYRWRIPSRPGRLPNPRTRRPGWAAPAGDQLATGSATRQMDDRETPGNSSRTPVTGPGPAIVPAKSAAAVDIPAETGNTA